MIWSPRERTANERIYSTASSTGRAGPIRTWTKFTKEIRSIAPLDWQVVLRRPIENGATELHLRLDQSAIASFGIIGVGS